MLPTVLAVVGLAFLIGGKLDMIIEHMIPRMRIYRYTSMVAQVLGFILLVVALGLAFG